jgi:hypothetical protein
MTVINCDMGEGFGLYKMGDDAAIMPFISVANVACGFHASDFNHMRTTGCCPISPVGVLLASVLSCILGTDIARQCIQPCE